MLRKFLLFGCMFIAMTSIAMWVASYARLQYSIYYAGAGSSTGHVLMVLTHSGMLSLVYSKVHSPSGEDITKSRWTHQYGRGLGMPAPNLNNILPIQLPSYYSGRTRLNLPAATIITPIWMLALLFGVWPFWITLRWILKPRFGDGCCADCGYDLRGTLERCPECGSEVDPKRIRHLSSDAATQ